MSSQRRSRWASDEGQAGHEVVEAGLPGSVRLAARRGPAPAIDQEAQRGQEVDQRVRIAHALHRWLSTDWWARKRPKAMKLR